MRINVLPAVLLLLAPGCSCTAGDTSCAQGSLLICNYTSDTIVRVGLDNGVPIASIGGGSSLGAPLCARIGPDGLLYVASEETDEILRYDPCTGAFIDVFVTAGSGGLNAPTSVSWGPDGNLYVSGFENDAVLRYNGSTGAFISVFVAAGAAGLNGPDNGTTFGPDGHLYIPGYYNNKVYKFNGETGWYMATFIPSISKPRVLVWDGPDLLVTSETSDGVRRFDAVTGAANGYKIAPAAGGLDQPIGLAKGPEGDWYVSSGTQDRVYRYDANGVFKEIFIQTGTPGVQGPLFLTFVPETQFAAADLNHDGLVDGADLGQLLGEWNTAGAADLDGSGMVDGADLGMMLGSWS